MALSGGFKLSFVGGVSQLAAYSEFSMQRTRTAAGGPSVALYVLKRHCVGVCRSPAVHAGLTS